MEEYLVHIWGGAWNHDAYPSVEKDCGIKEGYHYFKTKEEVDRFIEILSQPKYKNQGMMITTEYGVMSHKRTIFVGEFEYCGEKYVIHYDFGYEFKEEDAEFMFRYGNYSCDCNRSIFIRCEYGKEFPYLECGKEIKLIDYHFEYKD